MQTSIRSSLRALALALLGAIIALLPASIAYADTSLSVTITPPLFQLSIQPGQSWSSAVKIVNNNVSTVTYYAQAMDFEAAGENGNTKYIPLVDESTDPTLSSFSLASWITLPQTSVTIGAGQSAELPFTINVPQNAEPGGHYAAILIGTQPGGAAAQGALVNISSYVSSLLLVQIGGNVIENGRIVEFSTSQELYQSPQADFTLRFENIGNTHVRPSGTITISNMWGKQRGQLMINDQSGDFGNVLPKSIRRFQFSWQGDSDPFDIGLYSAVVTLSYGDSEKHTVSATTYFWVVPVVPVAIGICGLLAFIVLISWLIRRYIRHALDLERGRLESLGLTPEAQERPIEFTTEVFMEPIRESVIDLRAVARGEQAAPATAPAGQETMQGAKKFGIRSFLKKYRLVLLFIVLLLIGGYFAVRLLTNVLVPQRDFQITDVHIQEENTQ